MPAVQLWPGREKRIYAVPPFYRVESLIHYVQVQQWMNRCAGIAYDPQLDEVVLG